jgi:hypothetical protein
MHVPAVLMSARYLKSFFFGFGSLVDLWPAVTVDSLLPKVTNRPDRDAIASDWATVGNDLRNAMSAVRDE